MQAKCQSHARACRRVRRLLRTAAHLRGRAGGENAAAGQRTAWGPFRFIVARLLAWLNLDYVRTTHTYYFGRQRSAERAVSQLRTVPCVEGSLLWRPGPGARICLLKRHPMVAIRMIREPTVSGRMGASFGVP
jgi:hypothetical protein